MKAKRKAGILMPVSSLPSPGGIGTLGKGAYRFIDWLKSAGMSVWQVLPLLPTGYGDSPYQGCASDALNYYFIDPYLLAEEGLLTAEECASSDCADRRRVDYGKLFRERAALLKRAFARFDCSAASWKKFLAEGVYEDFALFMSLKVRFGYSPWTEWPEPYRDCERETLDAYARENREEIGFWQFTQYMFLRQWRALRKYAHAKGVEIMGDMPIYVSADSVEMWKYRKELFLLDGDDALSSVAGVPPDEFSANGQLWGNPVYDWEKMKKDDYRWWRRRIRRAFDLFDMVRIDHFRGFDRFYAIPAGDDTARRGVWLDGPKAELFRGLENCRIIAEDLGVIDDGVRALMRETGYPGMRVLVFSFDGRPDNEHKPFNYPENCVAYTGTHDNQPFAAYVEGLEGWGKETFLKDFRTECRAAGIRFCMHTPQAACQTAVRLLFASKARTVIVPMQDVLGLGEEARINHPSVFSAENWSYRFREEDFGKSTAVRLKRLSERYRRAGNRKGRTEF